MAFDSIHSFLSSYLHSLVSDTTASDSRSHASRFSPREPTPLESFSRTIRNYVPSSIPIPSAAPSPPRVSRPVSFGSFLSPSTHAVSPPTRAHDTDWKRRGSDASSQADPRRYSQRRSDSGSDMPVFSLDDDIPEDGPPDEDRRVTRYPGVGDTEEVLWAGWDTLADVSDGHEQAKTRCVLVLIAVPGPRNILDVR